MGNNKLGSWVASEIISMLNREREHCVEDKEDALYALRSGDYQGLECEDVLNIVSMSDEKIDEIDNAIRIIQSISE